MWLLDNLSPVLTTVGLCLDIAGAWLVAYEVVVQYRGTTHELAEPYAYGGNLEGAEPVKTTGFLIYEAGKYSRMWIGLGLLTVGFILQIASAWVK